jgi:hypothetical protein
MHFEMLRVVPVTGGNGEKRCVLIHKISDAALLSADPGRANDAKSRQEIRKYSIELIHGCRGLGTAVLVHLSITASFQTVTANSGLHL